MTELESHNVLLPPIFIVGPAGVGKTSTVKYITDPSSPLSNHFKRIIAYTTRPPRTQLVNGEIKIIEEDGVDYQLVI